MAERFTNVLVSHLLAEGSIRLIKHDIDGPRHWYDLYHVRSQEIKCGNGCSNSAEWLLYIHYHDGEQEFTAPCEEHAPKSYSELLEEK